MNKKEIITVVAVVWLLGTTAYMLNNMWKNYQINGIQRTYVDTINQVIAEAEKNNCQPLSIVSGEKKMELIDVKCLQEPQEEAQQVEVK